MVLLYIDDDAEDVELFLEAMEEINPGVKCVAAANGKQGLSLLDTLLPDYIFLDINMPIMNGRETLRHLKSNDRWRNIPVCIVSTTRNPDEIDSFLQIGAKHFLVKPNTFEELCRALKTLFFKLSTL
jgi:CheY-like chemotaxis protein